MSTAELDAIGARRLAQHGARSAPQLTQGFPGAACISIIEQAAHGVPGARLIRAGDVINVDGSAELDGYFADTGGTRVVPPTAPTACASSRTSAATASAAPRTRRPITSPAITTRTAAADCARAW